MRNPAAPPVLHRFRGKQIHTNKEFQRSNESLFPKKTLNRFHNPSVVWILPVIGHGYFLQKNVLAIPERLSHPPSTPRVSNSKDRSDRCLRAPRICSSRLQEIGFIHREVNLHIAQKICLDHSDRKTFECGKFLKHSLQQGYIAGSGRDVGKALVNDTPRSNCFKRTSYEHTIPLSNLFADAEGRASFQKWSSFRTAKRERCGSTTGEFCRWNEWSSAGSRVAAGERDSRHFHPMTFWRCTAASA